ncbi:hypothetical protein [Tumebacillus lipolyticus]|uniref:Uncharacterized protein n=1 Tax=Tumebacillus lipolyticus TaxID=1280370 RepID=A0ABW4ZRV9_9BACL
MSKGLIAALLISTALALALSFLPEQALKRWGGEQFEAHLSGDVPVIKMNQIVDELGSLKLGSHLQKVVSENERLIVCLAVPAAKLRQERNRPWGDIYKIAHRFLVEVPKQQVVEVRVVSYERPDAVAFAVIAERKDMIDAPKPDSQAVQAFVQQKLDVIENIEESR